MDARALGDFNQLENGARSKPCFNRGWARINADYQENPRSTLSDFGLRPSFGFRPSGFGISLTPPTQTDYDDAQAVPPGPG